MARLPRIPKLTRTTGSGTTKTVRPRTKKEQSALQKKVGRRAGGQESTIGREFKRRLYQKFFGSRRPLTTMTQFLQGQARAKLGMFGQAVSPNISNEADITLPPMIDPKVELPKPVANVNTLVMQMDALLKVARQVGALSQEQQNLVVEQIKQAKRIAKEAQMEAKPEPQAEMVQEEDLDIGNALAPLDDAMDQLSKSVSDLIDIINEKINEKCDCSSVGGLPLPMGGRGRKGVPGIPGQKALPKPAGGPAAGITLKNPNLGQMRNMPRADRIARANAAKPGLEKRVARRAAGQEGTRFAEFERRLRGNFFGDDKLSTMTDQIRKERRPRSIFTPGRIATGLGAAGALGGAMMLNSSNEGTQPLTPPTPKATSAPAVASTVGAGFRSATPSNEAINEAAVTKIAKPVVDKALGSNVLDTIPVSQSTTPATSAMNLIQGDVMKAGLDPTSGLVGPMVAMPALSQATARDVYTSIYNMPPENDPTSGPKLDAISNIVDDLIKKSLTAKIEPQPSVRMPFGPGGPSGPGGVTPITPLSMKPQTPSGPISLPPNITAPKAKSSPPPGGGGGGGSPPPERKQPEPAAVPTPPTPKVEGAAISSKSMENDMAANFDTSSATAGIMGSQVGKNNPPNQPKAPARGMDNVPDPVSPDMISIIEMCWFTSRV